MSYEGQKGGEKNQKSNDSDDDMIKFLKNLMFTMH